MACTDPSQESLPMNGFATIPEPRSLLISDERNIAPLTLPAEAFSFRPPSGEVVTKFSNGDSERKIHCNIALTADEKKLLQQLRDACRAKGLKLLPSITVMASRFLSRSRGDPNKAIELMLATQEWRLSYFSKGPVTDLDVLEDFKHGIAYFCGRDAGMRPVLIVRAVRIPDIWYKNKCIDKLIRLLIFCMEYMIRYMLYPGVIENNVLIVDLAGLALSKVPIGPLQQIYKVMSTHYIGRVFRFYIVNMPFLLSSLSGVVKALLTDRQRQKLCFVHDVKELRKDFALHQLEKDLGGTRPSLKNFFPFELQGGPFTAGYDKGATADPPLNGHQVLTEAGAIGGLWSPDRSSEENLAHEFTAEAAEWFQTHDLKLPRELKTAVKDELGENKQDSVADAVADSPKDVDEEQQEIDVEAMFDETNGKLGAQESILLDERVETTQQKPSGWGSCYGICSSPCRS